QLSQHSEAPLKLVMHGTRPTISGRGSADLCVADACERSIEMLETLSNLLRWLAAPTELDGEPRDVLMHPALRRMSQRELADLPLSSRRRASREDACAA